MTSTECTSKSGASSGNCAAGFGVCCLFTKSGDCSAAKTVNQNCTYIQNNGYPAADTTSGESCVYNFNRICNNLCQIRLDFDTFVTNVNVIGQCGVADDALVLLSPFSSSANAFPPVVCGTLTGQHMYFETGSTGTAGSLNILKGTGVGSRTYQVKVTYYTCDDTAKAPPGCTQYFTGVSGNIQSYNYPGSVLLRAQNYNNCIRQEEGYCTFQVREAGTITPDPFLLSAPPNAALSACQILSHIVIPSPAASMFCGGVLNTAAGNTVPGLVTSTPGSAFQVGVVTLNADLTGITGFNLDYTQIP
eukprot:maker-scaffold1854_size26324-snap-gene-0.2 protein:Tk00514 transcript:maker-scaffold1854_size26324-snap-gene-0.2-mRNA-1 annotation:"PREDICTED: uncharacterized protein LOC100161421"